MRDSIEVDALPPVAICNTNSIKLLPTCAG